MGEKLRPEIERAKLRAEIERASARQTLSIVAAVGSLLATYFAMRYGWGLEVHSWAALIGFYLLAGLIGALGRAGRSS